MCTGHEKHGGFDLGTRKQRGPPAIAPLALWGCQYSKGPTKVGHWDSPRRAGYDLRT